MASKNFKPDKGAKVTGSAASTFAGAISAIRSKGKVSDSANADAWAIKVNQRDWEHPATDGATPTEAHD